MEEERQTTEVRSSVSQDGNTRTEREVVSNATEVSGRVVASRIIWFIVGVIVVFLLARMVLMLLGANQGNGFVDFVYAVGGVFAQPFFGIFGYSPVYGSSVFEVSTLVAVVVYLLAGWGVVKLVNITAPSGQAE